MSKCSSLILSKSLFAMETSNRGLINSFTNKKANLQQSSDLLSFRLIGEQDYYQRIASFTSVKATNWKQHLKMFGEKKASKSRISQLERLIPECHEEKMNYSKRTGRQTAKPGEQLLELPLALVDSDGNQVKGRRAM